MDGQSLVELFEQWPALTVEERRDSFSVLPRLDAEELFLMLSEEDQADLLRELAPGEQKLWLRLLAPDAAADVMQAFDDEDDREALLALLDPSTRAEVRALMAYAEDDAGGLMSPRFARCRPEMKADEAIAYVRRQARDRLETIYYVYVLDAQQHLLGVVSLRQLFAAPGDRRVAEIMRTSLVSVTEETDQEELGHLFTDFGLLAIPVLDDDQRVVGIVTLDDAVEVVEEEATEDIHRMGGQEALDRPYLDVGVIEMIRKRAVWLTALMVGQMATTSAMERYEELIHAYVALAAFLPLIISSGGNSGSQASTLVIRAMALGQVRLRDWLRVIRRELLTGLGLGALLAVVGLVRVLAWEKVFGGYGDLALQLAATVSASLLGVVLWGTLAGSTLPLVLRRLGIDPAAASAPAVATLVDVTGLVIYFTVARVMITGTL